MFQLENEAQRAGIVKSGESFLKLSSSLPELIKFGKGRCKQFMKYHKKYVEDLDSATTQEQQAGIHLVSVYSVSVAHFSANFLCIHYITLSTNGSKQY